jgi:hypothetical protein
MKGLDLAKKYFNDCALPLFKENCPELLPKMTVGLAGEGSECLGFDDVFSRDHDWGPAFCVWLDGETFAQEGHRLRKLYNTLPAEFDGFNARQTSQWGDGRIGVLKTEDFYQKFLGIPGIPDDLTRWLVTPENALATATSGRIFHDSQNQFSKTRTALLAFYPDDVRLKKIAARCMAGGRSGQYNYVRCLRRGELFAARQAEMNFFSSIFSLTFLLNRVYMPFDKWAYRKLQELPLLGETCRKAAEKCLIECEPANHIDIMETLAGEIIKVLKAEGLTTSPSDFLADHGPEIQNHIQNEQLKAIDVWFG